MVTFLPLICFSTNKLKLQEVNVSNMADLVSYRGPRSMVTVDMSVDSQSTNGRYLGRASVATWSTLGR